MFTEEESRIELYDKTSKLIAIRQFKNKGSLDKNIEEFNKELLRVYTEFPNNSIHTDPRSYDWRMENCLNPDFENPM